MRKMATVIVVFGLVAGLASCQKEGVSKTALPQSKDYTLDQLDSIGKTFVPEIGTYGGTLRLATESDPDGFCPAISTSKSAADIEQLVFEGLDYIDLKDNEFKPLLAERWDVSSDNLVWTFHLRKDVYFSDGVKFSAEDVVFTFNDIIYSNTLRSTLKDNFTINGKKILVRAVDSFTVVFTLPRQFAPFLTVVGAQILPKHLYERQAKDGSLEKMLSSSPKPENVIGTGPFVLEKIDLGQQIVLKRNPHYWQKDEKGNSLPYLDKVVFLVIRDPSVEMLKFKSGELDNLSVMGEDYPILKPLEKELGITLYKIGPRWYDGFVEFNQNNQKDPKTGKFYLDEKKQKWFQNKNFRKACAYAINSREIINIVMNGLGFPPDGPWGKHKGYYYNPNIVHYDYDVDKAKKLLAQEGFKDVNNDGFVEDKDGNTVEFTIVAGVGGKTMETLLGIIRKDFENIGLKAHVNLIEFNNLVDKLQNTYDWDACSYAVGGVIDPYFLKTGEIFTSFRYDINPNQKKPTYAWQARIAAIFDQAVTEMDPEKRKVLYGEWQEIVTDQCSRIFLPLRDAVLGVNNRVGNIHLTSKMGNEYYLVLWNIQEVFIKQTSRK
jgi:peptide/nickel transport system substrate-binding protein